MSTDEKTYLNEFGLAIGVVGGSISMISNEVFHTPLGYSPTSVKNLAKVSVATGVSTIGVIAVCKNVKTLNGLIP